MRARRACEEVARLYPGPIGEMIEKELRSYANFGWRFGAAGLTERVVSHILQEVEKRNGESSQYPESA